jgi:hypothetical protein
MSKYALPGTFFLPVPALPTLNNNDHQLESTNVQNTSNIDDIVIVKRNIINTIQTRQRFKTSFFSRYVQENSTPFVEQNMEEKIHINEDKTTNCEKCGPQKGEFDVVVKKVIIDWVQYIKASLNDANQNKPHGVLTYRNRRMQQRLNSFSSPFGENVTQPRRRRQTRIAPIQSNSANSDNTSNDTTISTFIPFENAIQFDLSVMYSGQSYQVLRSLSQIRQLYKELVDNSTSYSDLAIESKVSLGGKEGIKLSIVSDHQSVEVQTNNLLFSIPTVPELFNTINALNNFQSLYAQMIQSYAPTIETWFRTVYDTIPSQFQSTISCFFYEPIVNRLATTATRYSSVPSLLMRQHRHQHLTISSNNNNTLRFHQLESIVEEEKSEIDEPYQGVPF